MQITLEAIVPDADVGAPPIALDGGREFEAAPPTRAAWWAGIVVIGTALASGQAMSGAFPLAWAIAAAAVVAAAWLAGLLAGAVGVNRRIGYGLGALLIATAYAAVFAPEPAHFVGLAAIVVLGFFMAHTVGN